MPRLSDIIRASAKRSTLALNCELNPQHQGVQKFVDVNIAKAVILEVGGVNKPVEVKYTLRVCERCWAEFVYDMTNLARELQGV